MRVLLLDNYDSFTYNLRHYVESFGVECSVVRNDAVDLAMVSEFDKVMISPGPGLPKDSGRLMEFIDRCVEHKPLLGICLGLQGITEHFNGSIFKMKNVAHGVALECKVIDDSEYMFKDIPRKFNAGMYHSWAVKESKLPSDLLVTARGENGLVMAIRHVTLDVRGLQFHPESIMTVHGKRMIGNWLYA